MNQNKRDTSRNICKCFTEHRVLRCFPMTFYIAFYSVFEKHVLCFSCSVNPSRLKHQIVGFRYRRCSIWCTRNAILYSSMALRKAFRYPLPLFPQATPWDAWESFGSTFFPKASAGGFLLGYARVEFAPFGASGASRIAAASIFH